MTVSRLEFTPSPAEGSPSAIRGGQAAAHPPEQLETLRASLVNRYRVMPLASTRWLPKDPWLLTSTVLAAAATAAGVLVGLGAGALVG